MIRFIILERSHQHLKLMCGTIMSYLCNDHFGTRKYLTTVVLNIPKKQCNMYMSVGIKTQT